MGGSALSICSAILAVTLRRARLEREKVSLETKSASGPSSSDMGEGMRVPRRFRSVSACFLTLGGVCGMELAGICNILDAEVVSMERSLLADPTPPTLLVRNGGPLEPGKFGYIGVGIRPALLPA
jgi:hypothetical protein